MFPRSDLDRVLGLIAQRSSTRSPLLVAIDGLGGAGKSTFATELSAHLPNSGIVGVDDFYRPMEHANRFKLASQGGYKQHFDWQRLRDEVLEPLSRRRRARFRRYDWATNGLADWRDVVPQDVVIVEGVFSTRPELRPLLGVTVYVDASREVRVARMRARRYEDLNWLESWMAAEEWYVEHIRPAEHVDLVLDGSGPSS
jgi:uridine kinase